MLRSLLSGKPSEILLGSYTQREACALSVPYIRSYRLQAEAMTGMVDACEFSFRGGRAGFIPCAANPLLLYVSLPSEGVYVELTGVEP